MASAASPPVAKRARTEAALPHLDIAAKIKESLYWSGLAYGHPASLLPPPPPMARVAGIPAAEAAAAAFPAMPPSIAQVLRKWIHTNPAYGTAPLERDAPPLAEEERVDLVRRFIDALPKKMRETPLAPELSTVGHENHQLRLGRRYGTDDRHLVPSCCNGEACAALKVRGAFGTPLQRYYTPAEHGKLERDPRLVQRFGSGPCLLCLRHDAEVLVRCTDGRTTNVAAAYGQPYVVMLRIYNTMNVPGGYKSAVFSSTPIESPEVTPIPIVGARITDISWQYSADGTWYIDQTALVWSAGGEQDF